MMWASGARLTAAAVVVALAAGCETRSLEPKGGSSGLGNVSGAGAGSGGVGGIPLGSGGAGLTGPGTGGAGAGASFTPTREVDMLFVVDSSPSAQHLQTNLLANFPSFLTALQTSGGLPSMHIAVITGDMGAGTGSIAGCSAGEGDAGLFRWAADAPCAATMLQPGATFISNANDGANYTGNIADVFACLAAVGTAGCSFQQPLAAVARALGIDGRPMPDESQGFLRPEAFLYVAFVAAEDDCSAPQALFDTASNRTLDSPLGPPTHFRCNEFGHLCGGIAPPRLAPNGDVNQLFSFLDPCTSAEGAGMLTPVATFAARLRALKRYPDQQIIVATITGPSMPYTVHWRSPDVADSGPWPEISHSCTGPDGGFAEPAIRIEQFASTFGDNTEGVNACYTSWAPSLHLLADRLPPGPPPPLPDSP